MQATIGINATGRNRAERRGRKALNKTNIALWTIQTVLAVTFLFAGASKLVMSPDQMAPLAFGLPTWFLRFLGVAEVAGALGLVLPGIARIRTGLTPLAAAGLVIIMAGATTLTAVNGDVPGASFPLVIGLLCGLVAYRRAQPAGSDTNSNVVESAARAA